MYTQVKLPPLISPMLWGGNRKISSLPFARGGLGWGNLRNNGDSITCVYTVAPFRRGLGRGFWHWCQLNVHVSLTGGVSHSVAYPCELLAAALRYRRRHQP